MRKLLGKGLLFLFFFLSFVHAHTQQVGDSLPARSAPDRGGRVSAEKGWQPSKEYSARLTQLRWQRNFLLAALVVLVILFLFYVGRGRKTTGAPQPPGQELRRLEELNHSKDQLLAIISHDLRSAMHALGVNISRIKALLQQSKWEEAQSLVENTDQITASTQSLLNNLLYWAMSQTGQISFHFEKLALKPLIEQVCYDFRPIAASKKIELTDLVGYPFACQGDANSVKIMLRNLIDNALKYTPPQGVVTITVQQDQQHCRITVTDSGIGMDEDMVTAMQDLGITPVRSDAYGRRSTGLGLWLVKNLAASSGGALSILSEKGIGTHITLVLPVR